MQLYPINITFNNGITFVIQEAILKAKGLPNTLCNYTQMVICKSQAQRDLPIYDGQK